MKALRFSRKAEQDFDEIAAWTTQNFGPNQAAEYLDGFEATFALLLSHPQIGKWIPHARFHRRSIAHGSHILVYRVLANEILVERIVHKRRLLEKFVR